MSASLAEKLRSRIGAGIGIPAAVAAIPAAVAAWQTGFVTRHPVLAAVLLLCYEAALGIGALLGKVLSRLVNRRADQLGEAVDRGFGRKVSRYGRHYRRYLLGSLRYVDAKGLATVGPYIPDLDEVFVDLSLTPRPPHEVPAGILAEIPVDVTQRRSIWEFLHQEKPAVLAVVGGPGSGKTTLLRYVARRAAARPSAPRRGVPILLELRDHATFIMQQPGATLAQVVRESIGQLGVAEPDGWWEEQLRQGSCLVLLDGLDEVAKTEDRRGVADWIEQQMARCPDNDFVVTSRPHGYRTASINGATVLQVRPFTSEQTRRFLHSWYRAVEHRATGSTGPETELLAQKEADDLLNRLNAAPALYDLTVNPLLLTMIANVHRYRGALPGTRADLYDEVCQVVLWRRIDAKNLKSPLAGLSAQRLLANLAYVMMCEQIRDLSRRQVVETLSPGLSRVSSDLTADDFLTDLGGNGLLVEREKDLYAFAHHTFQEFLAAKHIRENNLVTFLTDTVTDVWWRETTLLYVVGANADPIVTACLDAGTAGALALAFDCVEAGGELAPELRSRLDQTLAKAFRPGADTTQRRLVSAVLADRHLRHVVPTATGARVCVQPVNADLYWLFQSFQRGTGGMPIPYGSGRPNGPRPGAAIGAIGADAKAFSVWVSGIAGRGESIYRLPSRAELEDPTVRAAVTALLPPELDSVWAESDTSGAGPELVCLTAGPHPHQVTWGEMISAITADVEGSALAVQVLLSMLRSLVSAAHTVDDATAEAIFRALESNLDRWPPASNLYLFTSILSPQAIASIVLDLSRIESPEADPAGDHSLVGFLWRRNEYRDRSLAAVLDLDRELALALALDFDYEFAIDFQQDLAAFRHELPTDPALRLDDLAKPVIGTALARGGHALVHSSGATLAEVLLNAARFVELDGIVVPLNHLTRVLAEVTDAFSDPWGSAVAGRLAARAAPVLARQQELTDRDATLMRLPAVVLAAEAVAQQRDRLASGLRTFAAAVTLLQRRERGTPPPSEGILLAIG